MGDSLITCKQIGLSDSVNAPVGRSGHRIAFLEGDIYVIGGYAQYPSSLQVVGEVRLITHLLIFFLIWSLSITLLSTSF